MRCCQPVCLARQRSHRRLNQMRPPADRLGRCPAKLSIVVTPVANRRSVLSDWAMASKSQGLLKLPDRMLQGLLPRKPGALEVAFSRLGTPPIGIVAVVSAYTDIDAPQATWVRIWTTLTVRIGARYPALPCTPVNLFYQAAISCDRRSGPAVPRFETNLGEHPDIRPEVILHFRLINPPFPTTTLPM